MMSLNQILNFLESELVAHEVINMGLQNNTVYTFASTKKIIEKGLYYLTQEYITKSDSIIDSIVITNAKADEIVNQNNIYILLNNPQLAHYKLAASAVKKLENGVHPTAIISKNAVVSDSAYIGPYCVLEDCEIKDNVQLLNNVIVRGKVVIGENTVIEGNSVIGARGMAWIWDEQGNRVIQPQMGGVTIGANCIIGTDISIVRGSLSEDTYIGDGSIIAHGTKIGHGSYIGELVHMANNVSLAGNAKIGERTFLGSASVVSSNVFIAANCIVGAGAVVSKSNEIEYATLVGVPAKVLLKENYSQKSKGVPKPYKR